MKEHAEFLSDEQIAAEIAQLVNNPATLKADSQERDRYFADPANATEIKEQQELMNLVIALYEPEFFMTSTYYTVLLTI